MTIDERRSVEHLKNVFVALVEQEWKKRTVRRSCFRVYISLFIFLAPPLGSTLSLICTHVLLRLEGKTNIKQ